jgi:hypothetical protein
MCKDKKRPKIIKIGVSISKSAAYVDHWCRR